MPLILIFEPSLVRVSKLIVINKRLLQLCVSVCAEKAEKAACATPECKLDGLQLSLAPHSGQDQEALHWPSVGQVRKIHLRVCLHSVLLCALSS